MQELHATLVMANPAGRHLVEAAADYKRSPEELEQLRLVTSDLADAVSDAQGLFDEDVRQLVSEAVAEIGQGPRPERSTQRGETVLANLMVSLFKGIATVGGTAIVSTSIASSQTGGTLITELATFTDHAFAFLTVHLPTIQAFAGAACSDFSWLSQLTHLLQRARLDGRA